MGENVERKNRNEKYYCFGFRTACYDIRELHADSRASDDGEKAVGQFISSIINYHCIFGGSDHLHSDRGVPVG